MIYLIALLLGLVQGLCEFLPVSSSGHLFLIRTLTRDAVGEGTFGSFFTVMLHVATLIAVVIVYREQVLAILKKPFQKLTLHLILATLPTVVVALILKKFDALDAWLDQGNLVGASFLLTAVFLTVCELCGRRAGKKKRPLKDMRVSDALLIGGMQAIGVLPGVSRSGSTITGARLSGLSRKAAADFSFLLSIPAILGGLVLEVYKLVKHPDAVGAMNAVSYWVALTLAMLVAAISGYFAVRFMIRLITKKGLWGFAIYTAALGALVLMCQGFGWLGFGFTPFGG